MSVEWFFKLKEIDSLGKMRINHLKQIAEGQDRLSKLCERKEVTTLQTTTLNQEVRSLQQNLHDLEKKLKLASTQKENLISLGGDEKKILAFNEDIERMENEGLDLLTLVEEKQTEINDLKTFLTGLDKTMSEIQQEVNGVQSENKVELERIELRLKLLEKELPENFQQVYRRTLLKNLVHGPFTRIDNGSCFFCRYKISRQDESEIDFQQTLKTCNQCGRIFLPFGS